MYNNKWTLVNWRPHALSYSNSFFKRGLYSYKDLYWSINVSTSIFNHISLKITLHVYLCKYILWTWVLYCKCSLNEMQTMNCRYSGICFQSFIFLCMHIYSSSAGWYKVCLDQTLWMTFKSTHLSLSKNHITSLYGKSIL